MSREADCAARLMVFTTYLFVFYFLPLVLARYYALAGPSRGLGASDERTAWSSTRS